MPYGVATGNRSSIARPSGSQGRHGKKMLGAREQKVSIFTAYLRLNSFEGPGLHHAVAQQLETAVAVGLLSRGERLPPESELAAELGISTGPLRQALEALRQKGVIETRRGRGGGSFVRGLSDGTRELTRIRNRSADDLRDLGDASAAVVGGAARLAAQRALPEDVDRLRWFAGHFLTASDNDDRRRADSRFHIEIGVIGHSVRLTQSIVQLHGELTALFWVTDTGSQNQPETEAAHAALIAAIAAADGDAARTMAVEHVERRVQHLIDLHLDLVVRDAP